MAGLASVDLVTVFDAETPLDLITRIRPDVLIKGADYTEDGVVGAREVRSWGGDVRLALGRDNRIQGTQKSRRDHFSIVYFVRVGRLSYL